MFAVNHPDQAVESASVNTCSLVGGGLLSLETTGRTMVYVSAIGLIAVDRGVEHDHLVRRSFPLDKQVPERSINCSSRRSN